MIKSFAQSPIAVATSVRHFDEELTGVDDSVASAFLQQILKTEELPKQEIAAIPHDSDFKAQIYSVWNFPKVTNEVKHFGNIPRWDHRQPAVLGAWFNLNHCLGNNP